MPRPAYDPMLDAKHNATHAVYAACIDILTVLSMTIDDGVDVGAADELLACKDAVGALYNKAAAAHRAYECNA